MSPSIKQARGLNYGRPEYNWTDWICSAISICYCYNKLNICISRASILIKIPFTVFHLSPHTRGSAASVTHPNTHRTSGDGDSAFSCNVELNITLKSVVSLQQSRCWHCSLGKVQQVFLHVRVIALVIGRTFTTHRQRSRKPANDWLINAFVLNRQLSEIMCIILRSQGHGGKILAGFHRKIKGIWIE